jgi:hypothetical protein
MNWPSTLAMAALTGLLSSTVFAEPGGPGWLISQADAEWPQGSSLALARKLMRCGQTREGHGDTMRLHIPGRGDPVLIATLEDVLGWSEVDFLRQSTITASRQGISCEVHHADVASIIAVVAAERGAVGLVPAHTALPLGLRIIWPEGVTVPTGPGDAAPAAPSPAAPAVPPSDAALPPSPAPVPAP